MDRARVRRFLLNCENYFKIFFDLKLFDMLFLLQVFHERIGCYYVESKRMFGQQDSPVETAKTCRTVAWSRGQKYFALRNGSECLSDRHLSSLVPRLNAAKGCLGGRGGQNVSDVYRLTSKKAFGLLSA